MRSFFARHFRRQRSRILRSNSTEAGAILTFSNGVMEHIAMISGWEEFERFLATVRPVDVRVYGKLSAEAEAWVRQFGVVSRMFEDHVAGFVRYPP